MDQALLAWRVQEGATSQEVQVASEAGKGVGTGSSLVLRKEHRPVSALIWVQSGPFWISELHDCNIKINSVLSHYI